MVSKYNKGIKIAEIFIDKYNYLIYSLKKRGMFFALLNKNSGAILRKITSVLFKSTTHMDSLDLSNLKLVAFIGCKTGITGANGINLLTVAVGKGAKTAVGFQETIDYDAANEWTKTFFEYLKNGMSVSEACKKLALVTELGLGGLNKYVICGNKTLTLN